MVKFLLPRRVIAPAKTKRYRYGNHAWLAEDAQSRASPADI
jgi:hypothetical protein